MGDTKLTDFIPGVGPIIGGAVDLYSGWRQRKQAEEINDKNLEESRRVMAQQREWAQSDWDKVNAYNSPTQQMERYKEAGLNPNLIYGNAQNSPSAMVKNTSQGPARMEASGIIEGIGHQGQAISGAVQQAANLYFANKQLENDTNLKNAQILNLGSQSSNTQSQTALMNEQWEDLIEKLKYENSLTYNKIGESVIKQTNSPTQEKWNEKYNAQLDRLKGLTKLSGQESQIKQADIDMMNKLAGIKNGPQYIMELAKIILAQAAKSAFK